MLTGPGSLSAAELLAVLIGSGDGRGRSALGLAQAILAAWRASSPGDPRLRAAGPGPEPGPAALVALSQASPAELGSVRGIGLAKACRIVAGLELGRRASAIRLPRGAVRSPQDVADIFTQRLRHLDREYFWVVLLDTKNRIITAELISVGGLDAALVHPREIFKAAVRQSASSVILLHNHPSGDPTPSEADLECTRRLVAAGQVMAIDVLDHIIIGEDGYLSLREAGIGGFSPGVE